MFLVVTITYGLAYLPWNLFKAVNTIYGGYLWLIIKNLTNLFKPKLKLES